MEMRERGSLFPCLLSALCPLLSPLVSLSSRHRVPGAGRAPKNVPRCLLVPHRGLLFLRLPCSASCIVGKSEDDDGLVKVESSAGSGSELSNSSRARRKLSRCVRSSRSSASFLSLSFAACRTAWISHTSRRRRRSSSFCRRSLSCFARSSLAPLLRTSWTIKA